MYNLMYRLMYNFSVPDSIAKIEDGLNLKSGQMNHNLVHQVKTPIQML